MSATPRVFLSYARTDGEAFARALRQRLETEEPEITLWQDRTQLEGGVGWWKQITEALDKVPFMVLVMTPASVASEVVRKEWRHARQQGVVVYPVKGAPDDQLDFASLPGWMRKAHFFDLDHEWQTFVTYLKSPPEVARVPFMAPDLPPGFVERPAEFGQLRRHLLDAERENPVAITTALHGAGGFGKTTLAAALCHDADVQTAFDDGILWVTLGEKPNVQEALTQLYAALTGERPGFLSMDDAALHLVGMLRDRNCLLVIDDVWDAAHLRPFLRGGKGTCARLITTRNFAVAAEAERVNVDEMTPSQAVQLLTTRLPVPPSDLEPFHRLARRLGEWPLLLELAGATLHQRLARGDSLAGALHYLNQRLDRKGVQAFDQSNASERNQAIGRTIEVSLELLTSQERERCAALSIFPEDTEVPLTAVGRLLGVDEFDAGEWVQRFADLSLVRFNLQTATVLLHDVMRAYLATKVKDAAALHGQLVESWGDLHALPDAYARRWVAYHLTQAGRGQELRYLLGDFGWIQAKLTVADVTGLIADYEFLPSHDVLQQVGRALQLSAHVLSRNRTHLAGQLLGRLLAEQAPELKALLEQAKQWKGTPWLRPLTPSLTPPGGSLLRTLMGRRGLVTAVTVTPDGQQAVSAADDGTLTVWDLESGQELRLLTKHREQDQPSTPSSGWTPFQLRALTGNRDYIATVVATTDGRLVAVSTDGALKVWDLASGMELLFLAGPPKRVTTAAVTRDGQGAVLGFADGALAIYDLARGREVRTLPAHADWILALTVTPDGRQAVSTSLDQTLKVWDLERGAELKTLASGLRRVSALEVTADARKLMAGYFDGSLEVWDLDAGSKLHTLGRHEDEVTALAVTSDGTRAVSASADQSVLVWDLASGAKLGTLEGHTSRVTAVALTADGRRAVTGSWDWALKVWDLQSVADSHRRAGHSGSVTALAVTPEGRHVFSASFDGASKGRTLKVWDLDSGRELDTLGEHYDSVTALALAPDGQRLLSVGDRVVLVWNLASREAEKAFFTPCLLTAVAMTPDGRQAIVGALERSVRVLALERLPTAGIVVHGAEVLQLQGHTDWVYGVSVTPDGGQVISASKDGTVRVWDLGCAVELHCLQGHQDSVAAIAVMCDGRHAVSGSRDTTVRVWDIDRGTEISTLRGHESGVTAVAATSDCRRVVSAGWDRTLRVWDWADRQAVLASFCGESEIMACAVAPDGMTFIAGEGSGRIHFLRLEGVDAGP